MDVGRLIDCVKQHVYLYDISHVEYKNPSLKNATWELIAKQLNESSDTCKLKWKTVRDGYIKYKKQLENASNSGSKIIDYIWSYKLNFLDNCNASRKLYYKTTRKSDSTLKMSYSPPPLVSFGSPTLAAEAISSSFQNKVRHEHVKYIDTTDHLFLSYSETFKTFSPRQQALLKIELAKLFANAELKQLDNAEDSEAAADITSPVIIKMEYSHRASGSQISDDFSDGNDDGDLKPAKRSRPASVS